MKIERGDVFLVEFDPTRGSEIQKTRPAVVITNDLANIHSRIVTVVPLTSQKTDRVLANELFIGKPRGLTKESKAKIEQLRAVDKSRLKERISRLTPTQLQDLSDILRLHLGL